MRGLPVRDQAAPHQAVGPVVKRAFACITVLLHHYRIRLPPYESIVFAGENSVHYSVQPACGLGYEIAVFELESQFQGTVQPVGALLKQPSGAADHAVAIALACTDISPQPSVFKYLLILVEVAGNTVGGILRPILQPSLWFYLPEIQRDIALFYGLLAAGDTDYANQRDL